MASRKLNGAELARELQGLPLSGSTNVAASTRLGQPEGVRQVKSSPPFPPAAIVAQPAEIATSEVADWRIS